MEDREGDKEGKRGREGWIDIPEDTFRKLVGRSHCL